MRIVFPLLMSVLFLVSCSKLPNSQKPNYQQIPDDKDKVLRGVLTRSVLENDTSFAWFKDNMKYGMADAAAVNIFAQNKDKFSLIVFCGTWCEDSHNLLPVLYRLIDKSGYPESKVLLLGMDRTKTTINDLQKKFNVKNVPTFIVMQNGKEVGRVVEYGKYAAIDKELGEIVSAIAFK